MTAAVSDGHTTIGEASKVRDLGTIVVKCFHARLKGEKCRSSMNKDETNLGIVSEKALKGRALSHMVE